VGDEPTLADALSAKQLWLRETEQATAKLRGSHDEVQARFKASETALATAESETALLEQVTTLLQGLEAAWQKNFQTSVAKVISRGLTLVFEEPMELKIVSKVRADVTTVDFRIVQGEGADAIETDILGAKGGTVIALVNVLVRALLILSARPALRRIMILDEVFGLADPRYYEAFGSLLREMCDKLGFQIILVSHDDTIIESADVAYEVYHVSRKKGSSFRKIWERRTERT